MVCFKLKQLTTISLGDDAKSITVYQKSAIEKINKPMSGKPPMGYILSKKQIRDIVAYLSSMDSSSPKAVISH